MKKISLILFLFALIACDDNAPESTAVNIRITNTSDLDFTSFLVKMNSEEHNYGAIAAGESSAYHHFEKAYRYAYFEVTVDGEKYVYQPIDYVGEELLKSGDYSYRISIDMSAPYHRRVDLTLAKD